MAVGSGKDGRSAVLEKVLADLNKVYGQGTAMKLGDRPLEGVSTIPTGSLALDIALGVGGLPRGRVVEIFGPEGSGKTTLCSHVMAEAQRMGETAVFVDVEHAYDTGFARKCGVDVGSLIMAQPNSGEEALDIAERFVKSGAVGVVVVDSVAALVSKAEIEGEMGDAHVALTARLMSQALRKLTPSVSGTKCLLVFTNQIREKPGVMYGNPEVQPGGRALKFFSTVRIDVRRREAIKEGTEIVGFRTKFKVVKNKVAPPMREVETAIYFDQGISKTAEMLELGARFGIIAKSGAFYTVEGSKVQGLQAARELLDGDAARCARLEAQIREQALRSTEPLVIGGATDEAAEAA